MLHCDKSPDKLPQRPLRRRSLTPDRHGSDLASLAVVALVGMGAGISAYPIRASLLKRNCRPGLAIIITLEAAQLELQKIESMTTSIPLERDRDLKRRWYRLLQRAVPSGVPAGDRPIVSPSKITSSLVKRRIAPGTVQDAPAACIDLNWAGP